MTHETVNAWREYDAAAWWCAKRGYTGDVGSFLPANMSTVACGLIDADLGAFAERVRATAYALAMDAIHATYGDQDNNNLAASAREDAVFNGEQNYETDDSKAPDLPPARSEV